MSLQKLYHVDSPLGRAQGFMAGANQSFNTALQGKLAEAQMQPPPKTAGGGLMAAAGGAMTAMSAGSALTAFGNEELGQKVGGPKGMGFGAGLGALSYFLS